MISLKGPPGKGKRKGIVLMAKSSFQNVLIFIWELLLQRKERMYSLCLLSAVRSIGCLRYACQRT